MCWICFRYFSVCFFFFNSCFVPIFFLFLVFLFSILGGCFDMCLLFGWLCFLST